MARIAIHNFVQTAIRMELSGASIRSGKKLRADDAGDVSANLFVSPAITTGYVKWVTPTVINGHVYVGGQVTVVAFTSK